MQSPRRSACFATPLAQAEVIPASGSSKRIDAIHQAGVLRVGLLANAPWLVEHSSGSGEHWSGPARVLAKDVAKERTRDFLSHLGWSG